MARQEDDMIALEFDFDAGEEDLFMSGLRRIHDSIGDDDW